MKLLKLTLHNFKGIKDFTLDTQGSNAAVCGDNATGKTTLFDAFCWLLFDKDSQNKKDFQIKTLDAAGQVISGIDHSVEGVLDIGGRVVTLKKVYAEQWTKKRGSVTASFSGHTTDYYIDDVPKPKKEYDAYVGQIIDENLSKLLTNPAYFNEQLHWQERRKILLEICGDISDEEVINSDKSLKKLPAILQGRSLDDHRKVIAARQTKVNEELKSIPVRIDEADRALPDTSNIVIADLPADIAKLKADIEAKRQESSRIETGGEISTKRRQLQEIEGEILRIKNAWQSKNNDILADRRTALTDARTKVQSTSAEITVAKGHISSLDREAQRLEQRIKVTRETWYAKNEQQFEFEQESVCPTCGQALPEERLQEARDAALARFNLDKSTTLETLSTEGKALKAELENIMSEHSGLVAKVAELERRLTGEEAVAANLIAEIEVISGQAQPIELDSAYIKAAEQKKQVEQAIAQLQANSAEALAAADQEIAAMNTALESLTRASLQIKQREDGLKRIDELKAQEQTLAAEYERLQGELYLTEQFIRTKVNLLEERINSKFRFARFKLFDVQVNGGVNECCETLFNGVPYSGGLNNAGRIAVGLDIINTLSAHYNFEPVIFIDNAESITLLPETNAQIVSLYVSENDKKLRVEVDTNENLFRRAV